MIRCVFDNKLPERKAPIQVSNKLSVKTKTAFKDDKFIFDIGVNMTIAITERLFPFNGGHQAAELEKDIQDELQRQFQQLLHKIQGADIDPIGLACTREPLSMPTGKKSRINGAKLCPKQM